MDSRPSPHSIGLEFVRQYYTLLIQAPAHLHRLYKKDSSFKHVGSGRDVAVGQKQIDEQIKKLNFLDCQVNLIQIDCQFAPENGIAVQVFGELSKRGQPMRPFTQTIILAAVVPLKNYYVYNEIFSYQDTLGYDEIVHESSRSTGDDEVQAELEQGHSDSNPSQTQQLQQQNGHIVTPQLATVQPTTNAVVKDLPEFPIVNGIANTDEVLQTKIVAPQLTTAAPTIPVSSSVTASHLISQQVPGAKASIQTQQRAWKTKPQIPESVTPIKIENIEVVEEETVKSPTIESPIKQEEEIQPETVTSNEIKKFSTSVKSAISASPVNPWKIPLEQQETASSTTANISGGVAMAQGGSGARGPQRGGNNVRGMNRNDRPGPTTRGAPYTNEKNGKHSRLTGSNGVDGDRRRPSLNKHSDEQQLFLGNIPTYVTEEELKKFFTKFGNVIDVRIIINRNNNNMPEDRVRNFGFIIFETIESAKSVLVEKRIIFSDQNGDHRINVQEKKPRAKQAMDGSSISESGNSMAAGQNDAKGNGVEKNDNQVANNGQSGSGGVSGGSPKIRDGDTG